MVRAPLQLSTVLLMAIVGGLSGCTCTVVDDDDDGNGEGEGGAPDSLTCHVASLEPEFAKVDVEVAGSSFRVTWSEDIDPTSVSAAIHLTRLADAAEVPITLTQLDGHTFEVTPTESLRFWSEYGIEVGEGVIATTGDACLSRSTAFSTVALSPLPSTDAPAPANGFVAIGDIGIAASSSYRGLQIYDLTNPAQPVLTSVVETDEQPLGIAAAGDRAYVPTGFQGVLVFDLEDPASPRLAGVAGTPGYAQKVAPFSQGNRHFIAVADGAEGVRVLETTVLEAPTQLAAFTPSGAATTQVTDVDVEGDLLAVAQFDQGFALVDISTPSAPVVLTSRPSEAVAGTFDTAHAISDVALDEVTLYVSLGARGFEAFDITTPEAPVFLDHELAPQGLCPAYCRNMVTSIVADQGQLFASSLLTGAVRLRLDGSTLVTEATLPITGQTSDVFVTDEHLFVGAGRGLVVFGRDATDGASPEYAEFTGNGTVNATAVVGDRLYAVSASRGLQTFSLADPTIPALIDVDPTFGLQEDVQLVNVAVNGDRLVVADGRAGVVVFDLSNPDDPAPLGTIGAADHTGAIEFNGDIAYVCNDNHGMWVIDYRAQPPALVREISLDDQLTACRDLELSGGLLYVAEGNALGVFDVSVADSPVFVAELSLPLEDAVNAINLYDGHLLATTSVSDFEGQYGVAHRFLVFDLQDPIAPVRVYRSDTLPGAGPILRRGSKAFVSASAQGMLVFDVADPKNPFFEGLVEFSGNVGRASVAESGDLLYVAQRGRGIGVLRTGQLPADE